MSLCRQNTLRGRCADLRPERLEPRQWAAVRRVRLFHLGTGVRCSGSVFQRNRKRRLAELEMASWTHGANQGEPMQTEGPYKETQSQLWVLQYSPAALKAHVPTPCLHRPALGAQPLQMDPGWSSSLGSRPGSWSPGRTPTPAGLSREGGQITTSRKV